MSLQLSRFAVLLLLAVLPIGCFAQMACDCGYPGGPECPAGHPSPIILDLGGQGFSLTGPAQGVLFDITGSGHVIRVAWTAPGAGDAFLVLDRNGDGRITTAAELFGNFTPQPASPSPNGFLALAEFDKPANGGNGDGVIDANDAVFNSLRLWVDANHNCLSEPEELFTLPSRGITAISLSYADSRRRDEFGNEFRYRARVTSAPGSGVGPWAVDVFLATRPHAGESSARLGGAKLEDDTPGTVLGSEHPEQIPDDVVRSIFLRIASCPRDASPLQQKKCGLVRRAVGLSPDDSARLEEQLTAFLDEVTPLDQQITDLHRSGLATTNNVVRKALLTRRADRTAARDRLIRARAAALRQSLAPEGAQRLDDYLASMKAKIKLIPAATTQSDAATQGAAR